MPKLQNFRNKNTAEGKSWRTFLQAVGATVVAFFYGLWELPGVSEYTSNFVQTQGINLLFGLFALVGIPAGVLAYFWNKKS